MGWDYTENCEKKDAIRGELCCLPDEQFMHFPEKTRSMINELFANVSPFRASSELHNLRAVSQRNCLLDAQIALLLLRIAQSKQPIRSDPDQQPIVAHKPGIVYEANWPFAKKRIR